MISILFTDVVDSTALATALGPDRADEVREAHDGAVARAVHAAGGTIVKHLGDGFMATFPGPSAACDAAIRSQQGVAKVAERLGVDLAIRVGIAMGEATSEGDDWFGPPVVEAARLCAAAGPGGILISDRAAAMGTIDATTSSVGELELKGLDRPVPASLVAWQGRSEDPVPLPSALRASARLPFVGRADVAARLAERFERAVAVGGGLVLVAGEPGIGKSRLVAELATSAHADGAVVAFGRCDQDALFAYQPFTEAIRHLHEHGVVESSVGLDLLLPGEAPVSVADTERSRAVLLDAARSALLEVAADRPLVLALDDLHWADAGTLAMLRHVLRAVGELPFMVVGTYRDTDIDRMHPFGSLLVELRREHDVERILLDGLDSDAVFDLLGSLADHDLGDGARQLSQRLVTETSGNPFFVGEVLAHLAESGALVNDDGRWTATVDLAEVGLPEGVRDVVGQRLSRLSPDTNAVLAVVAVGARPIELSVLRGACDRGIDVIAAVEEAVEAALLVEEAGSFPRYGFPHALVRQTILDELTGARRLRIHATLADVLAPRAGSSLDAWLEAVHHAIEGAPILGFGRLDEILGAPEYTLMQTMDPDALVLLAERVDELGQALGAQGSEAWCQLLVGGAIAAFIQGDRVTSGHLARRAVALSRDVEDPRAFVLSVSALSHSASFGLDPDFFALLPEALEKSEPGTSERVQLLCQEMGAAVYLGCPDFEAAGAALLREAELVGTDDAMAQSHSVISYAFQAAVPAARALDHANCTLSYRDRVSPWMLINGVLARAYPLIRMDRWADARSAAHDQVDFATERGATVLVAAGHQQLAMIDMAEGALDAASAQIDEVERLAGDEPMFQAGSIVQRMWLAHLIGDHDRTGQLLELIDGLPYLELNDVTRGWLAGEAGRSSDAAAAADRAAALELAALPTSWVSPGLWAAAGLLAHQQERPDLAAQVVPLLERLSGEKVIWVCNFVIGDADEMLADLRPLAASLS